MKDEEFKGEFKNLNLIYSEVFICFRLLENVNLGMHVKNIRVGVGKVGGLTEHLILG